jgi:hypothetical protein
VVMKPDPHRLFGHARSDRRLQCSKLNIVRMYELKAIRIRISQQHQVELCCAWVLEQSHCLSTLIFLMVPDRSSAGARRLPAPRLCVAENLAAGVNFRTMSLFFPISPPQFALLPTGLFPDATSPAMISSRHNQPAKVSEELHGLQ